MYVGYGCRFFIHKRKLSDTGIDLNVAAKSFVWLGQNQPAWRPKVVTALESLRTKNDQLQ